MWRGWLGLLVVAVASTAVGQTVLQKLGQEGSLSEFLKLVEKSPMARVMLDSEQVTAFAFTNQAYRKYQSKQTKEPNVLNHICNVAQTASQLRSTITTQARGSPTVFITRRGRDIYVNSAKITRPDYFKSEKQVLHMIDDILETAVPQDSSISNPNAYQFLTNFYSLNDMAADNTIRIFSEIVNKTNKVDVFNNRGRYTFFIPVDLGVTKREPIDAKVIDGHVIPNQVIFTRPESSEQHETLANGDNIKVTITLETHEGRTKVKSYTKMGDKSHPEGQVFADIVRANIPVSNGVVHLIAKPLMVVDFTIAQFLETHHDVAHNFYDTIVNYADSLYAKIRNQKDRRGELTLFVPRNEAWTYPNISRILSDRKRLDGILRIHMVPRRLSLRAIDEQHIQDVNTEAPKKKLYFNILENNTNQTVTVEGGGVNATIVEPDIAATDGIIHIIDKILGIPYSTVFEKLSMDPMLSKTFELGHSQYFNEQLMDTKKTFTFFAPSNFAWNDAKVKYPSAYKKLFMNDFAYHARTILERHLVVGQSISMNELNKLAQNSSQIGTVRGNLKLSVEAGVTDEIQPPGQEYTMYWEGKEVRVKRPDVECTNGVIHVIDTVLMRESDVQVTGGSDSLSLVSVVVHLALLLVAKFLL